MKHKNKLCKGNKSIVVITTKPGVPFTQVTCLMSPVEYNEAVLERPDLIFTWGKDLPKETIPEKPVEDFTKGISVRGMTLPPDLEEKASELLRGTE